jgi:hypothetical protein
MKLLPSDPDIQTIVTRIETGDLDLQPNFQRGEVWTTAKKKKLIDSILRDWHVPPVHVVVAANGKQEVLDGQQRLVSIRDFVRNEFRVDGNIAPFDEAIFRLNNLSYSELPAEVKRAFDQFTIRVFRLTDYRAGEPGELFFRLNQMTYLTAAEQRNAFFGPVREQVRELVNLLESKPAYEIIGFSNRRMAYDDVLAKLLCTFESGTLSVKLGAGEISNRFREAEPFSKQILTLASDTVLFITDALKQAPVRVRFNKATLFTWLIFTSCFVRAREQPAVVSNFLWKFEEQRARSAQSLTEFKRSSLTKLSNASERSLLRTFTDRSSSRVSDVSSVIFRDLILWIFFFDFSEDHAKIALQSSKREKLKRIYLDVKDRKESPEEILEQAVDFASWGELI